MAEPNTIIFLPGIMGSRLKFPNVDRIWDPDSKREMVWWAPVWPLRSDEDNRLALHFQQPAGVMVTPLANTATPTQAERGWGGVVWSYYGKILTDLEQRYPLRQVHAVGYDWRQPIQWLGWYAAQRIAMILASTGTPDATIITHSMGGLVIRAALKADPSLAAKIRNIVFICPPHTGAVILYRRMFTGLVQPFDGGGSVFDRVFRFVLGNSRTGFLGNVSGLPGAVQLLPSPSYPGPWNPLMPPSGTYLPGSGGPPSVGSPETSAQVAADLDSRIAELNEFHAWLGAPNLGDLAATSWILYGASNKTEIGISFPGGSATPQLADNGDEVVPEASATALPLPHGQTIGFSILVHAEACNNDYLLQVLASIAL